MSGPYTERYADVKAGEPGGLRAPLRSLALDLLAARDRLGGARELLRKPRVQFLYVHHVFRDEEDALRRLLAELAREHAFIPYAEGVERVLSGRIDRPYICFSSDDGFKNNRRAAAILEEFGATACFFINPAIVGSASYEEVARFCRDRLHLPPVEFMDWADIDALRERGHEIGSHTMGHADVAAMSRAAFAEDCQRIAEILRARCGEARHFAFPYGRFRNFHEEARQTVFGAGFRSCASAERGCHIAHGRPLEPQELCIRRDHVILDWKLGHVLYFLVRNARRARPENNLFPYGAAPVQP